MGRIMNWFTVRRWTIIGIFNLLLVASFGLLMRLKVLLPLSFVDQKHIMHAHSHFAFSGWISHVLMLLMVIVLYGRSSRESLPGKYQLLLFGNLLVSYGMLVTFSYQGYGLYSICFSTLSILLSYIFAFIAWRDIRVSELSLTVQRWFRSALLFLVLSSIGTFYLAYLQKTGSVDTRQQLTAVYFFLHFQYNGWFFFTCMGLASHWLVRQGIVMPIGKLVYRIFSWACIPAYMLSILWYNLPVWMYVLLVIVVILQLSAWTMWVWGISREAGRIKPLLSSSLVKGLLCAVALAASIKFLLQTFSVIPSLSVLAYSFRPIVVGYLHLVLLGVITLFLLAFVFQAEIFSRTRLVGFSVAAFVVGVILNELLLMVQGAGGIVGVYVPHIPVGLAVVAGVMFVSLVFLCLAVARNSRAVACNVSTRE